MFRRWINFCTDYTGAPLCQKYDQEVIKKKKKVESQSWPLANFKKKNCRKYISILVSNFR